MGEAEGFAELARDAILAARSIDRAWFEESTPYEYGRDVMDKRIAGLVSRAEALGLRIPGIEAGDDPAV